MSLYRRIVQFSMMAGLFVILVLLRQQNLATLTTLEWQQGLGLINTSLSTTSREGSSWTSIEAWKSPHVSSETQLHTTQLAVHKAHYTRQLVIPRMKDEDISWIARELPDVNVTVYVADDPSTLLHSPKNRGHEVMVYLSYIIDHYDSLPDVVMFMHAHRWAHHNNEMLGYDAPQMIRRLSGAHVVRQGYVNLRCHWSPGCPEWLHPHDRGDEVIEKQEEAVLLESWDELFPSEPLPLTLAQPCCAQFALSRKRIRSIPLSRFVFFRDWILRTPLNDYVSGRIWEYSWQYLFTSQGVLCPAEHLCYCEAFRLCFGGVSEFETYQNLQSTKLGYEKRLTEIEGGGNHTFSTSESDESTYLYRQVDALNKELASRKKTAFERGDKLGEQNR